MKLIVDVGVGVTAEGSMRRHGDDVLAVRDIDARMPDTAILAHAAAEGRLLLTMDKDFGDLAVRHGLAHAGVLLLRLDDATGHEKAEGIAQLLSEHGESVAVRPGSVAKL